jgi:hypothetical protein
VPLPWFLLSIVSAFPNNMTFTQPDRRCTATVADKGSVQKDGNQSEADIPEAALMIH